MCLEACSWFFLIGTLITAAATPTKANINADELAARFRNFGKLSIQEQREAIRKTFAKVVVDYDDDDGKPVIMKVELRMQPHN